MADLVCEPVAWEEYHRALVQVDDARAELARVTAERDRLEKMRRLDYELVKDFDVYGTGGDVSSCLREMKMVLSEKSSALAAAPEVERVRKLERVAQTAIELSAKSEGSDAMTMAARLSFLARAAQDALAPEPAAPSGCEHGRTGYPASADGHKVCFVCMTCLDCTKTATPPPVSKDAAPSGEAKCGPACSEADGGCYHVAPTPEAAADDGDTLPLPTGPRRPPDELAWMMGGMPKVGRTSVDIHVYDGLRAEVNALRAKLEEAERKK